MSGVIEFEEAARQAMALPMADRSARFAAVRERVCAAIRGLDARWLPEDRRAAFGALRDAICLPSRRQNDAAFRRSVRDARVLLSCYFEGVTRNPVLTKRLLEGIGTAGEDLSGFSEQQIEFHRRQILSDHLANGRAVSNGSFVSAIELQSLAPAGIEFLKRQEASAPTKQMLVFVSHSSHDTDVAAALIDVLLTAFGLDPQSIRCTSLAGHRLPVGVTVDSFLKGELQRVKGFIGLLTPNSVMSTYVLFELGARWGAGLHLAPVLSSGLSAAELQSPLAALMTLSLADAAQVFQLVDDLGSTLELTPRPPSSYSRQIQVLNEVARRAGPLNPPTAPPA